MKQYVILFVVFLLALSGCTVRVITENQPTAITPKPPSQMLFSKNYDKVWDAAIKTITDLPIVSKDKASGRILSGWKELKGAKRERLNILLKKEGNGTKVSIESHMEVLIKSTAENADVGTGTKMPRWRRAFSDTMTTDRLFIKINEILSEDISPSKKK